MSRQLTLEEIEEYKRLTRDAEQIQLKLDELMKLSGRQLLVGKGTISHEEAK